jgi:hypothetical protein
VSASPAGERNEDVVEGLKAAGIRQTLVRLPSWERVNLFRFEAFCELLRRADIDVVAALLQCREDVHNPASWRSFLEEAFSRFSPFCSFFEIGHAWNRT